MSARARFSWFVSPALITVLVASGLIVLAAQFESRRLRRRLGRTAEGVPPADASLRGLLGPYRPAVTLTIAVEVLAVLAGLAAPWPVKAVIDSITGSPTNRLFGILGSGRVVVVAVGVGVALVGAMCVLDYLSTVLAETIGACVGVGLRRGVLARLVRLPVRAISPHRNGDLLTRLTTDVTRVQQATLERWRTLVPNALAMVGMVVLMALLSPALAAVTALLAPLTGLAFWVRRQKVSEVQREARTASGELASRISEMARSIPAIQAFGREDAEHRRLDAAGRTAALASIRAVVASARLAPFADLIVAINLGVVLSLGAQQVHAHRLSIGGLVVFLTYLGAIQQPVRALSRLSRVLGSGVASRERLAAILREPELPVPPLPQPISPNAPIVTAHHVSYSYTDGRPALSDVTFCIPAGQITTVVGKNGAGKTTLLQLLMRLDDPDTGAICFDGIDARDYDPTSLRETIAVVPQDVWLTDGTLRENVLYGASEGSSAGLEWAARLAQVDEIADRLPSGWDTPLGEGGKALSGGERRRVAIARAILRDCRLLLLDEPTIGLDLLAEQKVVDAIRAAAVGRTTVIVTHSPALAAVGSRTLRLEKGSLLAGPVPVPELPEPLPEPTEPVRELTEPVRELTEAFPVGLTTNRLAGAMIG